MSHNDLIVSHLKAPDAGRVMFLGCADLTAATQLAHEKPQLYLAMSDVDVRVLEKARRHFESAGLPTVQIMPVTPAYDPGANFDLVVIEQPQSRALARRWLCEARQRLIEGGWLYLAGPNELGIKSVIDDMRTVFASIEPLGYGRHGRAARAQKHANHMGAASAWMSQPGIMPGSWHGLDFSLDGQHHTLYSLPGIFSYERIDAGTALLLESMLVTPGSRVLDAGCGYGPLGIAAALRGAAHVDMIDVNALAIAATRHNLQQLTLPDTVTLDTLACDGLSCLADQRYELIVSNLPFHQGKQTDRSAANNIIVQGSQMLQPGGRMLLVANVFLPYEQELNKHFGSVTTIAKNRSFRVLEARH